MLSLYLLYAFITVNISFVNSFAVESTLIWTKSALSILDETISLYEEFTGASLSISAKEKKLYNSILNISQLIQRVEHDIPQITIAKIKELERDFSQIIHFEIQLDDFIKDTNYIETSYDQFLFLRDKLKPKANNTESKEISTRHSLEKYADSVVSYDVGSVRNRLDEIHEKIIPRDTTPLSSQNIFALILNNFNSKSESRCLINNSPQQLIFNVYSSLKMIQLKGLILFEFSYMILHLYTGGDYKDFMTDARDQLSQRFIKQAEVANTVMESADNTMWKCDPRKHVSGVTYTEITRFIQGYIHNEKEMSREDSCFDGCGHYEYVDNPKCSNKDPLCSKQNRCKGRLLDCKFVDEDMEVCFSHPQNIRRYEWIAYQNGNQYGDKNRHCSYSQSKIKMYRNLLVWRCLYCFCLCDEESSLSDRFFSLEESTSDIKNNKIVVGVRFIKKNRVIYLQVKEAELLKAGTVDNKTLSWVNVSNIYVDDLRDLGKYHKLKYENRAFDLDDIFVTEKFLVTGVKLRTIGAHLNLEVRLTGFDFESGTLYPNLTFWKGNDNTDVAADNARRRQSLPSRRLPISSEDYSVLDSQSDSYVEFTYSDEKEDVAQSTVPYIDIQPVEPNPPIPLIGIGIVHKGNLGSGGFLEPKVFTYNLGKHI